MENSVYFYLFVSVDTFQMSVQIQFALKHGLIIWQDPALVTIKGSMLETDWLSPT